MQKRISMSDKKGFEVKFRIQRIETLQFAILQEEVSREKLAFSVNFGFGIDPANAIVRSTFRYEMLSEDKSCLIIEVAIDFEIEKKCFEADFFREGKLFIEKGFATHLSMVVVGTTRGILHEKTREMPLNLFPIPTVNVLNQITDDIYFENN